MTQGPEFLAEQARVDAWIAADLEAAMGESEYGRALHEGWKQGSIDFGKFLAAAYRRIFKRKTAYNRALVDSLVGGEAGSYYKALLMQALLLSQTADRTSRGQAHEKVRITFLPSNSRYAAIYEPHVAKGWLVIGVDWGVLCAVMTVASVVSHCLQGRMTEDRAVEWRLTPASAIEHFDRHPELKQMWVEGLTPAIVPSLPPKPPMFSDEPHQAAFGTMLLQGMIFGLVAHEYGHAIRSHLSDERRHTPLRSQLEHEADGMSIMLAMLDPWKALASAPDEFDPQQRTLTVAGCFLMQSVLKWLQVGDRMASDLTGRELRASTHPDPMIRMSAMKKIFDMVAPANTVQRREVDTYALFLFDTLDAIWNKSVDALFTHLSQQEALRVRAVESVPNADLRFL
ncbi:hypothetical protein ACFPN2_31490 [Steroidobacter flavus]|uniref:Peptidase M48 domain-containing protein n=1 Tax=Steroidobacter flavus TaxID=1842136 RepID=A0ABV8T1B0_9GAMM